MEIFPPIVLDGRSHISLVEIRIPKEDSKSFTFTNKQEISTDPNDSETKMTIFPKGVYNIHKLRFEIKHSPLAKYIDLNIETTNNNIYIYIYIYIYILQQKMIQLEFHQNLHKYLIFQRS